MNKYFLCFLTITIILVSCREFDSDIKKITVVNSKTTEQIKLFQKINKENIDTTIEVIKYPEYLTLTSDSLIIKIRNYTSKYNYSLVDTIFLMSDLIEKGENLKENKKVTFSFSSDSTNFEFFTAYLVSTNVDLDLYSLYPSTYSLVNTQRKYRGGPSYFHIESDNEQFVFDGKSINSISFMSQISPFKFLIIYDVGKKYKIGYTFSIGIFDTRKYKSVKSLRAKK